MEARQRGQEDLLGQVLSVGPVADLPVDEPVHRDHIVRVRLLPVSVRLTLDDLEPPSRSLTIRHHLGNSYTPPLHIGTARRLKGVRVLDLTRLLPAPYCS